MLAKVQIAVDTGGTFSDFTYFDVAGDLHSFKVPSTPESPEKAVINGLRKIIESGVVADDVEIFIHGTTVGTNTLLQEHGGRTALLITEGFDAVYEVQEQARPYGSEIFNLKYQRPKLLVDRSDVVEIPERIGSQGEVVRGLDLAEARKRIEALKGQDIEAIAICFLFSFINSDHEKAVQAIVEEVLPGIPVTLSSGICPFIREYYRLSTTVINAYLTPKMDRYLSGLDNEMSGLGIKTNKRYVMQSNGGVASISNTARRPVSTLMSGLAGGVMASLKILEQAGISSGISFDMGGTSCDVAVSEGRSAEIRDRFEIDGRHICLPSVQVETLSAGGGTLAWVDDLSQLHVGPESAGAVPGPVAYGRGGDTPTVTDCNVALGYLGNRAEVAEHLTLDVSAAKAAISEKLAIPLDLDEATAALGVLKVIDIKMSEAIRALATSKGLDLRDFTLVSFGGAGPLHSSRIMRELNLKQVLVPAMPGVTSALGLLEADVRHEFIRTRPNALNDLQPSDFSQTLGKLRAEAIAQLSVDGFSEEQMRMEMQLDLRYQGQGYELSVDVEMDTIDVAHIRKQFDAIHAKKFGHAALTQPVELMAYRVIGIGVTERKNSAFNKGPLNSSEASQAIIREAVFDVDGVPTKFELPVWQRTDLSQGSNHDGPLVIEQADTTTLIVPGQYVFIDDFGNLIVRETD
jgi:N-methylhydantoinase A